MKIKDLSALVVTTRFRPVSLALIIMQVGKDYLRTD